MLRLVSNETAIKIVIDCLFLAILHADVAGGHGGLFALIVLVGFGVDFCTNFDIFRYLFLFKGVMGNFLPRLLSEFVAYLGVPRRYIVKNVVF